MPTPDERARFARAHEALQTVAVTGTNGKTTTTSMVAAIVAASGEPSSRLTTLGAFLGDQKIEASSPASEFLETVEPALAAGVKTFALEVTSKALRSGWATQWPAEIAVFTNLSRDHMDMHGSPEAYFAAKAQLFMAVPPGGCCILNAADENSELLAEVIPAHAEVHYYDASRANAKTSLSARRVCSRRTGLVIELAESELANALGRELRLPVIGEVHAANALAAALATHHAGYSYEAIELGLERFLGVPGRFQVVATTPLVVVDYAHTPDGLRGTLMTARTLVEDGGRLALIFGCGGERDQGKRPLMAKVAHALADAVMVTNDNPRREDPMNIAEQIRSGATGPGAAWSLCLDRPEAIRKVVAAASPGDVVVIAGKGHEQVQEIGSESLPMCDVELATSAMRERGEGEC